MYGKARPKLHVWLVISLRLSPTAVENNIRGIRFLVFTCISLPCAGILSYELTQLHVAPSWLVAQ